VDSRCPSIALSDFYIQGFRGHLAADMLAVHGERVAQTLTGYETRLEPSGDTFLLVLERYFGRPQTLAWVRNRAARLLLIQVGVLIWVAAVMAVWVLLVVYLGIISAVPVWLFSCQEFVVAVIYRVRPSPNYGWHPQG
jgi:hypothetical protein